MKTKAAFFGLSILLLSGMTMEAAVHYVDGNNPNPPASPFTSWATAAITIQDAVDVSAPGDEVIVTNGIYATGGRAVFGAMTNRVAVDRPVFLHSVNGAQVTVIQGRQVPGTTNGDGAIRCVYLTNGAVLSGFTLSNGATRNQGDLFREKSGGALWCETAAAVSNCVLVGNQSAYSGGGAFGGTLYNCLITRNSNTNYGGGCYSNTLYNCTLSSNSGIYGGGAGSAVLNNCILYFNTGLFGTNYLDSTLNYCCTTPQPSGGNGNITVDPLFVDLAGGNLRLQSNSPCINAGNNAYAPIGTDLDGNLRILDSTVDMGAYEFPGTNSPIAPYIVTQPTNQTATVGSNAIFTVTADGALPLSYQWSFYGTNLNGATTDILEVTNVQPTNAGNYFVVVTNAYGAATSSIAVLTVTNSVVQTWTLTSAPLAHFSAVASSADGNILVAVVMGGPIYRSTNSGAAWMPAAAPATNWSAVASSADGIRQVAVVNGGEIYTSTNSGATWSETSAPATNWASVASSADGTKLAAGVGYSFLAQGLIYTSTNFGATWSETGAPVDYWFSLASSADGAKLVAGSSTKVYTSTNSGTTWRLALAPFLQDVFLCAATSADGTRIATGGFRAANHGIEKRPLYTSTDSGATWQDNVYGLFGDDWKSASYSADGSKLVALTEYGLIYTSTNGGVTIASNNVIGQGGFSVASSADGAKLVAVARVPTIENQGIYVSQITPSPSLDIAYSADGLMISWIVPSAGFVLQQNSNLTTANCTDVATTPILNFTNIHYQVSIPTRIGTVFYRLRSQ